MKILAISDTVEPVLYGSGLAGYASVRTSGDLLSALRDYRPGDSVRLTVVRDGKERAVDVELGDRPT